MSLITIVYLVIAAIVFLSVLYNLLTKEEKVVDKVACAMILVPLALRLLMIKYLMPHSCLMGYDLSNFLIESENINVFFFIIGLGVDITLHT